VIEDDPAASLLLVSLLRQHGLRPVPFSTGQAALQALETDEPVAVCLDLLLPDASGEAILLDLRAREPDLPVIVLSGQGSVTRAVDIMKLHPFDYFVKPFDHDRLVRSVDAAIREFDLRRQLHRLEREVRGAFRFEEIVGRSARMQRVYEQVEKVLENRVSVFIHGRSGTGKELVARAIHCNGPRRTGPFVTLNCGAIAEGLQESELFGHEKGAFTGAVALARGKFEQAHQGTLFLDEVGELSAAVQTRLLRVLQEGTLQRLGAAETITVDVRIISATHQDLEALVAAGRFREDLYYRLVVFPLEIPPLRERAEDIPLLVQHFVRKQVVTLGVAPVTFEQDAIDVLCRYDWPGNVRELENVIVRTLVSTGGGRITAEQLPQQLLLHAMGVKGLSGLAGPGEPTSGDAPSDGIMPLKDVERLAIERALKAVGGNMTLAAKRLGVGRATLYRKLTEYGMGGNQE
jgi:DNA-binding NtrC family response regulator